VNVRDRLGIALPYVGGILAEFLMIHECKDFNGLHNRAPGHQLSGPHISKLVLHKNDIAVCIRLTDIIGQNVATYARKGPFTKRVALDEHPQLIPSYTS
jgi:hypothetical protein